MKRMKIELKDVTFIEDHPREGMTFCVKCRCSFLTRAVEQHQRANPQNHPE